MKYPLSLENIGEDVYSLMSRGHHDLKEFDALVKKEYSSWFKCLGHPEHAYFKQVFHRYVECKPETRGCFPVTYVTEGRREILTTKE